MDKVLDQLVQPDQKKNSSFFERLSVFEALKRDRERFYFLFREAEGIEISFFREAEGRQHQYIFPHYYQHFFTAVNNFEEKIITSLTPCQDHNYEKSSIGVNVPDYLLDGGGKNIYFLYDLDSQNFQII